MLPITNNTHAHKLKHKNDCFFIIRLGGERERVKKEKEKRKALFKAIFFTVLSRITNTLILINLSYFSFPFNFLQFSRRPNRR